MIVYKFGGASVRSGKGVKNLCAIVRNAPVPLFIVVSAMGKTTNAMEEVHALVMKNKPEEALVRFAQVEEYHNGIMGDLFREKSPLDQVTRFYAEVRALILENSSHENYDRWYDRIVGYGELISTTIISEYLNREGIRNTWIDMHRCFVTDNRFREANINTDLSASHLKEAIQQENMKDPVRFFVGQGFIGATSQGEPTTLGREGSDYSAAMVGSLLDAEKVVIWKDVEGILNADPRIFQNTIHIPELTYLDAIELAYSGAQVIHPKTIKPLQNKQISLYVCPFAAPDHVGSVIRGTMKGKIEVPIFILKRGQVLISIRPKDFSFVLEDRLAGIFAVLSQYRQKINLIQSSAVNLSVCVDESRHLERIVEDLQLDFRVVYNRDMELLTIRGYTPDIYEDYTRKSGVYLVQKTRRIVRIVRHGEKK